jgi:hypothetical protein
MAARKEPSSLVPLSCEGILPVPRPCRRPKRPRTIAEKNVGSVAYGLHCRWRGLKVKNHRGEQWYKLNFSTSIPGRHSDRSRLSGRGMGLARSAQAINSRRDPSTASESRSLRDDAFEPTRNRNCNPARRCVSRVCHAIRRRSHWASCTQRNPKAPERSMLGAIIRSLPCSVNLYACGKYQIDPCGW